MAETKTLSILETIKRKMHKLDKKTEPAAKAADVGDEFEYISQPKIKVSESTSPYQAAATTNSVPDFKDDLGFEDMTLPPAKQHAAPAPQAPAPTQAAGSLDDFNLNDFDLDDENSLNNKLPAAASAPAVPPVAPAPETAGDFDEEEEYSEDYEDDNDLFSL